MDSGGGRVKYWTVLFDRDGGESEPEGFEYREEAVSYAEGMLCGGTWQWVTCEIQEGDE